MTVFLTVVLNHMLYDGTEVFNGIKFTMLRQSLAHKKSHNKMLDSYLASHNFQIQ